MDLSLFWKFCHMLSRDGKHIPWRVKKHGASCLVWKFDGSLFGSFFSSWGWNIAWEYVHNMTCKGNPGEIRVIKWRKVKTFECVILCSCIWQLGLSFIVLTTGNLNRLSILIKIIYCKGLLACDFRAVRSFQGMFEYFLCSPFINWLSMQG